jgi:radical SAM protein with 4Fe4S-binding SPASM domain
MTEEKSSVFLHGGMTSEAEIQRSFYEKGLIYTLQIEMTLRCTQGCSYCYAESKPDSPLGLSTNEIKSILNDAKDINVRCIDWLGGDPLVRKDWYDILLYSQELGLINNIWTSGIPLQNFEIAKKAIEVTQNGGFISVHLDSINPAVYEKVHHLRIEENISAILKGVDNVLALGKSSDELWNCITLTKQIASADVYNTMEWFWKEKGIRTVLTLYNPVNNQDFKHFIPSNDLIQQAYSGRDKILYNNELTFSTMDVNKYYCGSMICITYNGYYTPCSVIRTEEFGNVRKMDLKELFQVNPGDILMKKLRNPKNLPEPCQDCDQNEVCFGCRSSAFYFSGDMFGCDPKCPRCTNEN